jgi:hypothetical protein
MALYQYKGDEDYDATLFGNYHGVMESDPWDMPIQTFQVPGLYGVAHLIDKTKGRHLSCMIRYQGFSSYYDLEVNLAGVDAVNGTLTGTVFFEGVLSCSYPKCTFIGFERMSQIKYDGSGQNGWWIEGRLHWIQRTQ